MVVGRIRRTLKRSLSMAMAAALMVTSVPQLSVTSMAQEEENAVWENGTDEHSSEMAGHGETEEEKSPKTDSADTVSTDETDESAAEEKKDSDETQETGDEQDGQEKDSEDESGSETDSEADEEDQKQLGQDITEEESETEEEEEEKKVNDPDKGRAQEDAVTGKTIYENNFDAETEGSSLANGTVAKLADGNMAVEYDVDLSESKGWTDIFQAGFDLNPSYDEAVKEKLTMGFDVYFPDSVEDIGKIKAKAVLKVGDEWTWTEGNGFPEYTASDLNPSGIEGYKKIHVVLDLSSQTGWTVGDITSIKSVIPCLAGDVSTYKGKLYLDNVVLSDTSTSSGEDDPDKPEDEIKGKKIYENNFDAEAEGSSLANGTVAKLADGNMAVEYDVDLSESKGWTDIFQAGFDLNPSYDEAVKEKLTMGFDVYFPDSVEDIGKIKAKAVLKVGDEWTWTEGNGFPEYTASDLNPSGIEGYKKIHVVLDLSSQTGWTVGDITSIKSVIPCLAGDVSTYKGKLYLDNVVLSDTSKSSGEDDPDKPGANEEIIYQNNFDAEADASLVEEADGKAVELAELADGNKAVKFTTDLSGSTGWTDIFKAQINLPEEYAKTVSEKVVMSYDVYFPEGNIKDDFGTIKAQAALKSGADWTWISQKSWPGVEAGGLADSGIPGYKVFHIQIDMNDFQTWNGETNVDYPFENITPIKTVIPCLAGDGSKYAGDVYLDNLVVKAVNKSEDIPEVEGDLMLELDASAWKVSPGYQYNGQSTVRNENVGEKTFLVFNTDYSNDSAYNWSEAKFDYTHPADVATLQGYNAFKADIYYKPADKTAGSFGIKLFSNTPKIDKDTDLPAGEPADIPGLEGYYKAEYKLDLRIPSGVFNTLTVGFVGKSTDFKGDIYLDNMRFTKVVEEDIYVDSTIKPEKGPGIQVVDEGRSIQTASGNKVAITEEVALVDAKAIDATRNLYAYLKAVGESDSVIFGHQNDTHHKAGSAGEGFSNSDTEDVTGSIAGVVGIDALSLTGNEASTWDAKEADRIAKVVEITRDAASKGALITLSAHMPNFDVIDKRVKAYEASDKSATDSDLVGYWDVDGDRQYNFSGYTPGTLTGNVVTRVMPGQDLNYLYTDYLDLIADYAKAVEGDGITILFRPLHENTGSWFWWGAALCDEQAYINLYRYTVDYLKETKGVHNMLYVYGPGSEAANSAEYGERYPGDAYVDMIGYDLYHQMPSPENEAGYLQSISRQNAILKEFATEHNKLYAITETGVADKNAQGGDVALLRTGNKVQDWYMQLLNEISDDGVCYFLVWANFSENGSFYLPYVIEKKEGGVLHGHEMTDEFIKFYNDGRSVFATDMNSGFNQVSGVVNTTKADAVSGYITAPQSGDRILPDKENPNTRIAARVSGVDTAADVEFVVETDFDKVILKASYNEAEGVWEAVLKDSALLSLGEALGTISLFVNNNEIAKITAKFNMEVPKPNDMIPEDFEGYNGDSQQLGIAWATNKASGSEIAFTLTDDPDKVFGGKYGLRMDVTFASGDAWAGATKGLGADWSAGNALEFYTIPETKGQKVVVQVTTSGNTVFETYLQEFESYTSNAANGFPVKVTIPFSAFTGRDNKDAKFDPGRIESIGLWCNAIAGEGQEFPLSTTLYYDEFKIVTTDKTAVDIEPLAKKGIWIKEIPDQTYTGKAVKPDVQVYDDANLLTLKKDYTVTYKNNTKKGTADVIIKGKGNYSQTITGHFEIKPKSIEDLTITVPEYLIENGKDQNIAVTVKDGKKKLSAKNDYTQVITYNNAAVNKANAVGIYTVTITMKGNYEGEAVLNCEMADSSKSLLSKAAVTLPAKSLDYKGGNPVIFENESQIVVKLKGKPVSPQDYTVAYENNEQVGTASVVITAKAGSAYVGSCRKTFAINGTPFSAKTIEITSGFQTKLPYTGKAVYQNPVLKEKGSGTELEKNVDYRITYQNNLNAGKATMIITGLGKYSGTIKNTFTIDKISLTEDMVESKDIKVLQNRAGAMPDVVITYMGKTLVKDRDYKLTYANNKNITTASKKATVKIAGKGNYTGSQSIQFEIAPKSWDSGEITVEVPDIKYADKAQYTPNPVVYDNGKKLTKNKDYEVKYESNTKADIGDITSQGHTAKVVITLTGADYVVEGKDPVRSFEFRIIEKLISEAKVSLKPDRIQYFSQYGTRPGKDDLTITYKNETLTENDYDIISYDKNDRKGKATLVIQGKGQYGGTKKFTFAINPRGLEENLAKALEKIMSAMMEQL